MWAPHKLFLFQCFNEHINVLYQQLRQYLTIIYDIKHCFGVSHTSSYSKIYSVNPLYPFPFLELICSTEGDTSQKFPLDAEMLPKMNQQLNCNIKSLSYLIRTGRISALKGIVAFSWFDSRPSNWSGNIKRSAVEALPSWSTESISCVYAYFRLGGHKSIFGEGYWGFTCWCNRPVRFDCFGTGTAWFGDTMGRRFGSLQHTTILTNETTD